MRRLFLLYCLFLIYGESSSQSCFPDNDDPTITLNCSQNCTKLSFRIPDLRETSAYTVLDIPYDPLPFSDPRATAITFTGSWPGNSYSALQNLPFDFCFFGSTYNSLAIGANGTVSFDATVANQWCDPFLKRGPATFPLPNPRYARALIAGVMHDLDPGDTARASTNHRIDFRILGDAPCRKAVINFFQVPLWPGPQRNCQSSINTHQIIIYESTGIIDVFIKDSPQCAGSNEGYNTVAIQNFARDLAFSPRNKNCVQWGGSNLNLGYRFLPSGGNSMLVSAKLFLNGRDLGDGVVSPGPGDGELTVDFMNMCPTAAASTYVLRASYNSCPGPGTIELYDTIYVNKTNSLTATAISRPAQCTSNTGLIAVDVPAGTGVPPLQFSLNGGPPQASNTFTNLAAGSYLVTVTDASICSDNLTVVVGTSSTLNNITIDAVNTSCNGASNGSITVDPGTGVTPVVYSINGGPTQSSNVFPNLPAGNYTIGVFDAAGCTSTNNMVTILPGPPLSASYTKTDITCFGNTNGTITVGLPVGGNRPFQYSIDGGTTYQTSNVFAGLAAGNYIIDFRDAGNCSGRVNVSIIEPAELRGTASVTAARCNGESNGTITVNLNGGTFPYEYSLDGVTYQSSNLFFVAAGTYTVYTRDRNGCTSTIPNNVVTQPTVVFATAISGNATCNGGNDGTITVTAGGGSAGYFYSIDAVNFQASAVFNVAPGFYTATVRDANGCSTTVPDIEVQLTNNLTVTPAADERMCEGSTVQLQAVSNATQYAWTPSTGLSNAGIANPSASPTVTTEYIVTATLGRCSAKDTVLVNIDAAPVPDAGPDGDICVGQTFRLQGSGGVSYEWSPSIFLNDPAIADPVVTPDRTIEYSLHIMGGNGCRSLQPDKVIVNVTPPIKVTTTPYDTIVYEGEQFQALATSIGTSYTWTPSTGLSSPSVPDPVITAGVAGDVILYKVTAFTSAGCKGDGYVKVQVYKGPELYVPGAFTPNGDGKNDKFFPFPVGIKELVYFKVFNRWGQLVFSTNKLRDGWDGKFGGQDEATGVYVWAVQARTKDNKVITRRGTVTLIR
jgi:gliding motility-associated-like protein